VKVFFNISSLKSRSGSERVACILANQLVEILDYDVTIINRDANFNDVAYPLNDRICVKKIPGSQFQYYKGLVSFVSQEKPDIVIVHNMGKLSLLCSLIPNINRLVSLEHVSFISRPIIIQLLTKLLYKKIDQVIALTNSDKSYFDKFHQNVIVLPNFSPFPVIEKKDFKQKQIVAIGRLTDQKNYIHLLKAWEKIFHKILDWKLCIYGDGEHKNLLNEYIQSNAIKNVYLKESTSDIKSVYNTSSFFVMSSKYEGLPMVLIEAQSFGLPIISYNCPNGPSDIVKDQHNGFLVENQNIFLLSEKILELANSPEKLQNFSKNSSVKALEYQSEKILQLWVEHVFKG